MLELKPDDIRSVLIVKMSALGDVIHALPALTALKRQFPAAEIDWLVEPLGAGLLEAHPSLRRIFVIPRQEWKRRIARVSAWGSVVRDVARCARPLRERRYDLILDFQGNTRSAVAVLLARGKHRVSFHRRDVRERVASLVATHHVGRLPLRMNSVEKNLAIVRELGYQGACPQGEIEIDAASDQWAAGVLAGLPGSGPVVALHPAVSPFGEIKRWPVSHFRELADRLHSRGVRTLITWGPGELDLARAVGRPTVLNAESSLKQFAALLARVDAFVAADTGVLPLAALLGVPTVGLYGPKDAAIYEPYPNRGSIVTSPAPCSPCLLRRCAHRICMALISPAVVCHATIEALASRGKVSAS